MGETPRTGTRLDVREVGLRLLASLWSTVMSLPPETSPNATTVPFRVNAG